MKTIFDKTRLLNIFGVSLVIIGLLFFPWFNYHIPQHLKGSKIANSMAHISVSPFVFSITLTSTSNRSVYETIEVLSHKSVFFYSLSSFLIGFACVSGVTLGLIGKYVQKPRIGLIGGSISLFSTLFFPFLLPSSVLFIGINCYPMWGFWLSILGSILILISSRT